MLNVTREARTGQALSPGGTRTGKRPGRRGGTAGTRQVCEVLAQRHTQTVPPDLENGPRGGGSAEHDGLRGLWSRHPARWDEWGCRSSPEEEEEEEVRELNGPAGRGEGPCPEKPMAS